MHAALVTAFATGFGLGFLVAAQVGPHGLRIADGLSGLGIMGFGGLLGRRAFRHT
jgi:hypothetical protein